MPQLLHSKSHFTSVSLKLPAFLSKCGTETSCVSNTWGIGLNYPLLGRVPGWQHQALGGTKDSAFQQSLQGLLSTSVWEWGHHTSPAVRNGGLCLLPWVVQGRQGVSRSSFIRRRWPLQGSLSKAVWGYRTSPAAGLTLGCTEGSSPNWLFCLAAGKGRQPGEESGHASFPSSLPPRAELTLWGCFLPFMWAVIIVMGDPCFMLSECYRFSWYLSLLLLPSSLPFAGRALHRRSAPGWPNESLSWGLDWKPWGKRNILLPGWELWGCRLGQLVPSKGSSAWEGSQRGGKQDWEKRGWGSVRWHPANPPFKARPTPVWVCQRIPVSC